MRYVQLRAFHYVAILGGFSRAAEHLFLTQPAISDQVRRLEEEYDVLLFMRQKRQVTLTPQGERLLEITRRLFDSEHQALELLSENRALRSGSLRIVADSAHHLLHILARFRERYPGVRISVKAGNSDSVTSALRSYEADVGVLGEMPQSGEFQSLLLNSTPIIAFVAKGHALAQRPTCTLHDLAGLPLVFREDGSRTRRILLAAAEASGVTLVPAIEAEGREAVREIVASGAGVGFVSAAEFGHDARLVAVPVIETGGVMMDEALICLKERKDMTLVSAFFQIAATTLVPNKSS